jgi:hypothetical protein
VARGGSAGFTVQELLEQLQELPSEVGKKRR